MKLKQGIYHDDEDNWYAINDDQRMVNIDCSLSSFSRREQLQYMGPWEYPSHFNDAIADAKSNKAATAKLSTGDVITVGVTFVGSSKVYTYRANRNLDIGVGDTVRVGSGTGEGKRVKVVRVDDQPINPEGKCWIDKIYTHAKKKKTVPRTEISIAGLGRHLFAVTTYGPDHKAIHADTHKELTKLIDNIGATYMTKFAERLLIGEWNDVAWLGSHVDTMLTISNRYIEPIDQLCKEHGFCQVTEVRRYCLGLLIQAYIAMREPQPIGTKVDMMWVDDLCDAPTTTGRTTYPKLSPHMAAMATLKVGDRVQVRCDVNDNDGGWELPWMPRMDAYVGNTYTIASLHDEQGVLFEHHPDYKFPAHVLKKIESVLERGNAIHEAIAAKHNFKIGDTVRITGKNQRFGWCSQMDEYLDSTHVIASFMHFANQGDGAYFTNDTNDTTGRRFVWPIESLEKVEEAVHWPESLIDLKTADDYKAEAKRQLKAYRDYFGGLTWGEMSGRTMTEVDFATLEDRIAAKHCLNFIPNHHFKTTQPKETPVSIKIETVTYVTLPNSSQRIALDALTDDQAFEAVAKVEAEVNRLGKVEAKSDKLVKRIEALKASVAELNALIDARPAQ